MPEIKVVTDVAGRVCALPFEIGASVGEGDDIAFVEAMKMEIPVASPVAGKLKSLLVNRMYLLAVLGYAAYTFALGGIATWMAPFLERVRGVSPTVATVRFGGIVVMTGLVGTYAGGWLGDALLARTRHAYLWLSGFATLAAAPLFWVALAAPSPGVYWGAMVIAELLMFASTGPINSAIVNVASPTIRATAVAISIFTIHALGDVQSPWLVGRISDARSLATAVLILPVAAFVAGSIWCYAAWRGAPVTPAAPAT